MKNLIVRIGALLVLGVVDYTLHRPWRYFALVAIVLYAVEWTAFRHRKEMLYIIRHRRHRLANQLQLTAGWLQLGAAKKAEESLQVLLDSESAQSLWFRGLPSRWSYLFLRWDARAEGQGAAIRWLGLESVIPTYWMSWMLERRLTQAIGIVENLVIVQFRGHRFRIQVPETLGRIPSGWIRTPEGVEVSWRGGTRMRSAPPGPSARM